MEPIIVPRSEHPISRKLIDADAVKVLYRLHRAGYQAYLVGGGVRDLLLDRHPKDFDISTDAHPHQVKRLFRNCRLIGRRFRLAHVHFGEKILEVSTFRKRSEPGEDADTEDILIRSDNTFGTAEEDSLRRDFTINGLFYDISNFSLIDYVGGLADLNERMIRTIGDPDIRFREDPVRMIRAVKFAARLDFGIEEETYDAILRQREEILKSARPRLLEEIYRLLGGGAAVESFRLMFETGLLDILIPEVADFIETHGGVDGTAEENPLWGWLGVLDKRKVAGITLANPLLLGALLSSLYESRAGAPAAGAESDDDGSGESPGWVSPEEMLRPILTDLVVPRRDTEKLMQIFRMQRRFTGQRSRRFSPRAFVTKSYFRDAFSFFEIGVEATGREVEALARWQTLAEQAPPPSSAGAGEPRRRRRRRRRRGGPDEEGGFEMENGQEWSDDPEEVLAASFADGESEAEDEPEAAPRLDELDDDDDDEDALAARLDADAATGEFQDPAPASRSARGEHTRAARSTEVPETPRPTHGGHATGARPGGDRGRREGPPHEARPRDGVPRENRPRDDQRPPAPAPPARPPRGDDDEDEDSQIRFLGWSDQPAILNPRAHAEEPVPNPYLKDRRGGGGGPRRGGDARGPGSRGGESRGGRGGRGRPSGGYGGERSGGSPGYHSRGNESPRDGQPGGRDPRGGGPRSGGGRRPASGRDGRMGDLGGRSGPGPRKEGGFGGGEGRGRDPRGGFPGGGGGYSGGGGGGTGNGGTGGPRPQGGGARRRGRRSRRRD